MFDWELKPPNSEMIIGFLSRFRGDFSFFLEMIPFFPWFFRGNLQENHDKSETWCKNFHFFPCRHFPWNIIHWWSPVGEVPMFIHSKQTDFLSPIWCQAQERFQKWYFYVRFLLFFMTMFMMAGLGAFPCCQDALLTAGKSSKNGNHHWEITEIL